MGCLISIRVAKKKSTSPSIPHLRILAKLRSEVSDGVAKSAQSRLDTQSHGSEFQDHLVDAGLVRLGIFHQ